MRACFRDNVQFERFRAGEDNGLANINDAEYSAHYDRIVGADGARGTAFWPGLRRRMLKSRQDFNDV